MNISSSMSTSSIDSLVAQYMLIERQPVLKMEDQKTEVNSIKSIYSELKSKLSALRSSVKDLKATGTNSQFLAKSATSANESIITASASGDAVGGSHLIKVTQLAKADTIISNQLTRSSSSVLSSAGTGTKTFSITINGETTQIEVDINAGDDNSTVLSSVIDAINSSDADVSASIVNDTENTSKLVLRSDNTGSNYGITISDVSGNLMRDLGINDSALVSGTTGGYIYADTELDAKFELDGISITNDNNIIDDVLTGVTVNLKSIQEDTEDSVQITIETDTETVQSNLEDFFEKYNEVINFIKSNSTVDPDIGYRGKLTGDSTFLNLRMNLRTMVSSMISSVQSGNPTLLSEVGIEPDDAGNLSITDTTDFNDALELSVSKVEDLFNSDNGIATQIYDLLTPFTKTGGIIDGTTETLDLKINRIDNHIESLESRLRWKEDNYRKQFTRLQQAFAAITSQQSLLQVISSSISIGF